LLPYTLSNQIIYEPYLLSLLNINVDKINCEENYVLCLCCIPRFYVPQISKMKFHQYYQALVKKAGFEIVDLALIRIASCRPRVFCGIQAGAKYKKAPKEISEKNFMKISRYRQRSYVARAEMTGPYITFS